MSEIVEWEQVAENNFATVGLANAN